MKKKLFVLLVVTVLLFGLTPVQAIIPGEDAYQPGNEITSTGVLFSDIPETLSPAVIEEAGHIARLRDQEINKNTAVFRNADGTNTLYFFAQDIWYETPQGQKLDYSTEIELQPNGRYIGNSNNRTLVLPQKASQGFTYTENGYTINMVPSMDTVISTPIVYEQTEALPEEETEDFAEGFDPVNENAVEETEPEATEEPIEEPAEPEATEEPAEEPAEPEVTEEPAEEPAEPEATEEPVEETEPEATEEPAEEPAEPEATEEPVEETEIEIPIEETVERPYSLMNTNTVSEYSVSGVQSIINGIILNKPAQLQNNVFSESGREKSTLLYENIYSSNTDIETVPLLHGVRQDIKINNLGRTSFSFRINTNGLIPQNSTGYSITFADNTGKEQMAITSEPVMDESGNISDNNILDIAPYPDGSYLVTLTVDEEFVADAVNRNEEVVAPMATQTIDDEPIYDTFVQKAYRNTNFNSSAAMVTGCYGTFLSDGEYIPNICRIYIKFLLNGQLNNINPDNITGEALFLKDYSSSHNGATSIKPCVPNLKWDNTTLTYDMAVSPDPDYYVSNYNGILIPDASTIQGTNEWHTINLTRSTGRGLLSGFIRWNIDSSLDDYILHENRGIMLKNTNQDTVDGCRTFRTANASEGKPYARITYNVGVTSVSVSPASATLTVGGKKQLTATVSPSGATNKVVNWTTSKSSVATVSSSGKVTAKAVGTATITATTVDGNKTDTCVVTVKQPVDGVSVTPETVSVRANNTKQLTAEISPSNATNKDVTWTSSNTAIATVDSSGEVKGKAFGNATITATTADGAYTDTCAVRVYPETYTVLTYNSEYEDSISHGEVKWYRFNPTESKYYEFYSTGSTNVKATLYKQANQVAFNDDGGEGLNFYISKKVARTYAYFLKVECVSTSSEEEDFTVGIWDQYGAAREYTRIDAGAWAPNCFAYAMCMSSGKRIYVPYSTVGTLTDYQVATAVKNYIVNDGYASSARVISSPSDSVALNEYRICGMMSKNAYEFEQRSEAGETIPAGIYLNIKYHFIRQTSDGTWAHRYPEKASQQFSDMPSDSNPCWQKQGNENLADDPYVSSMFTIAVNISS